MNTYLYFEKKFLNLSSENGITMLLEKIFSDFVFKIFLLTPPCNSCTEYKFFIKLDSHETLPKIRITVRHIADNFTNIIVVMRLIKHLENMYKKNLFYKSVPSFYTFLKLKKNIYIKLTVPHFYKH